MIDDTPYIIVDNHKIAPIWRAAKPDSAPDEQPDRMDLPFGVVDRVTISREAIEKYRQFKAAVEADSPIFPHAVKKPRTSSISQLTESAKKHA